MYVHVGSRSIPQIFQEETEAMSRQSQDAVRGHKKQPSSCPLHVPGLNVKDMMPGAGRPERTCGGSKEMLYPEWRMNQIVRLLYKSMGGKKADSSDWEPPAPLDVMMCMVHGGKIYLGRYRMEEEF